MKRLAVGLALVLSLTGCAAGSVSPSASPSTQVTDLIPVDPLVSFKKIAADSCDKAFNSGVVETRDDYGLLVMIPKAQAIDGFSAVFQDKTDGSLQLIYESDSFYACAAALMFDMAAESGGGVDEVTVTYEGGKYVLKEKFEDSTFTYTYDVVDGLIAGGTVSSTDDPEPTLFTETYGDVGADNIELIKKAVAQLNTSE